MAYNKFTEQRALLNHLLQEDWVKPRKRAGEIIIDLYYNFREVDTEILVQAKNFSAKTM